MGLDVAASIADCCGSSNSRLFRRCSTLYFRPHASDALVRNGEFDDMFSAGFSRVVWLTTDSGALAEPGTATVSRFIESNLPKIG